MAEEEAWADSRRNMATRHGTAGHARTDVTPPGLHANHINVAPPPTSWLSFPHGRLQHLYNPDTDITNFVQHQLFKLSYSAWQHRSDNGRKNLTKGCNGF